MFGRLAGVAFSVQPFLSLFMSNFTTSRPEFVSNGSCGLLHRWRAGMDGGFFSVEHDPQHGRELSQNSFLSIMTDVNRGGLSLLCLLSVVEDGWMHIAPRDRVEHKWAPGEKSWWDHSCVLLPVRVEQERGHTVQSSFSD